MTYNVHLLLHYVECVRWCGPLWCYSLFHFEGNNGKICRNINGTTDVLSQVTEKYLLEHSLFQIHKKTSLIETYELLLYSRRWNIVSNHNKVHYSNIHEDILKYIEDNDYPLSKVNFYHKTVHKNDVFTTAERCKNLLTDDSAVELLDGRFGIIKTLFEINTKQFAAIEIQFRKENTPTTLCRHIFEKQNVQNKSLEIIELNIIKNKCVHLLIDSNNFFIIPPNRYEKD